MSHSSHRWEGTSRNRSRGARAAGLGMGLAAALLLAAPGPSHADDYGERSAGHPLRILAYAIHPVGVALDYLVFRPAHRLVHHEPLRTLFGHEDD